MPDLKKPHYALAALVAVGFALRLVNIGTEPYWADEIMSLDIATTLPTVRRVLAQLALAEFHPPLYYLLVRGWASAFGTGEAAVRSLSAIFSVAVIPVAYACGRRILGDARAGMFAAALLAVMPMALEYGQEARPYAAVSLAAALSMLFAWEWRRTGRTRYGVGYALSALVGLYLHYAFALFLFALAAWLFAESVRDAKRERSGRPLIRFLVAHAAVFVGFFPWLPALLAKIMLGGYAFVGREARGDIPRSPLMTFGALQQLLWLWPEKYQTPISALGILAFLPAYAWGLADAVRRGSASPSNDATGAPSGIRYVALLFFLPFALFVLSPLSQPYTRTVERHVIFLLLPLALLLGRGFSLMRPKVAAAACGVLLASFIPHAALVLGDDAQWDPDYTFRPVAQHIAAQYQPGDLVISSVGIMRIGLAHYLPDDVPIAVLRPFGFYGNDVWATRHVLGLIENEAQVRLHYGTPQDIAGQLDRIMRRYRPKRVWLYNFEDGDPEVLRPFRAAEWRPVLSRLGDGFPLYLFARR